MSDKADQRLRITLRQLEVFAATARTGSTRAAAERVARSQSAASTALAELEAALGLTLFDRVGRRLLLNENGRALLPRAASLLDQATDVEALFTVAHAAPLRLAASFTIGEYLLPRLLSQWKGERPQSQVQLAISNTTDVVDAVARFAADIGFIEGQRTHRDLVVTPWLRDELVVVVAPTHPLAGKRVGMKPLAQATWILRERGSGTREAQDGWLLAHLGAIKVELELGSNEAIKQVVASGLGLGCLSRYAVAQAIAQGWLVELQTRLPPNRRALAVVVHGGKRLGESGAAFLRHCFEGAAHAKPPA